MQGSLARICGSLVGRNLGLFSRFGEGGFEDRYFKYKAVLREYGAVLQEYRALSRKYSALLLKETSSSSVASVRASLKSLPFLPPFTRSCCIYTHEICICFYT